MQLQYILCFLGPNGPVPDRFVANMFKNVIEDACGESPPPPLEIQEKSDRQRRPSRVRWAAMARPWPAMASHGWPNGRPHGQMAGPKIAWLFVQNGSPDLQPDLGLDRQTGATN